MSIIEALCRNIKPVHKLWGEEFWLENNESYCLKLLRLLPGYACSFHFHRFKKETFIVATGRVRLEVDTPAEDLMMSAGDKFTLEPRRAHRFRALCNQEAWIIETSTHHEDSDTVRITDSQAV